MYPRPTLVAANPKPKQKCTDVHFFVNNYLRIVKKFSPKKRRDSEEFVARFTTVSQSVSVRREWNRSAVGVRFQLRGGVVAFQPFGALGGDTRKS